MKLLCIFSMNFVLFLTKMFWTYTGGVHICGSVHFFTRTVWSYILQLYAHKHTHTLQRPQMASRQECLSHFAPDVCYSYQHAVGQVIVILHLYIINMVFDVTLYIFYVGSQKVKNTTKIYTIPLSNDCRFSNIFLQRQEPQFSAGLGGTNSRNKTRIAIMAGLYGFWSANAAE